MLWPEKKCCEAFARKRIDRRLGAGRWSDSDPYACAILESVERFVPNRLGELVGGTFGAVVLDRGAFYGFVEMGRCSCCDDPVDITLLDVRLLSLINQTTRLLYGYIDKTQTNVLAFLPFDDAGYAAARELLRYHVHRTPEQIIPSIHFDGLSQPHRFMSGVGNVAKTWVAIHESSHLGPGRGRPQFSSHRQKQMVLMAHFFRAPLSRVESWAEEATADANAFQMMHIEMYGPGRRNPAGDDAALWTSVLSTALVYALKLIETMQWSTCPPEQGIALGRQHATTRHPPTSLRYRMVSREAAVYARLRSEQPSTWQASLENLTDALDDLFRVRPQWLREEEALIHARIERATGSRVRSITNQEDDVQ
jgi:hypothetical protein